MRKREMSQEQLALRNKIIARLKVAGWQEGVAVSGFDDGEFVLEEAVMELHDQMDLTVSYSAAEARISLIAEVALGRGVTIVMKCLDEVDEVLDLIVSFQSRISEQNFQESIAAIVDICPETYADLGDEGLVRLDNAAPRRKP